MNGIDNLGFFLDHCGKRNPQNTLSKAQEIKRNCVYKPNIFLDLKKKKKFQENFGNNITKQNIIFFQARSAVQLSSMRNCNNKNFRTIRKKLKKVVFGHLEHGQMIFHTLRNVLECDRHYPIPLAMLVIRSIERRLTGYSMGTETLSF